MWASQIPVRCGSCFYPRLAGEETGQRALETCSGRPGFQEQSWVLLPAVPISPGGAAHSHVWFPRSFCGAWMLPGAPKGPGPHTPACSAWSPHTSPCPHVWTEWKPVAGVLALCFQVPPPLTPTDPPASTFCARSVLPRSPNAAGLRLGESVLREQVRLKR